MTVGMELFVKSWLLDPTGGRFVAATVAILIVVALVRASRGILNHYVEEPGNLHRARKMVSFLGYFIGLLSIAMIFSDSLGEMAVAFGVAGAGIAFALQEVIASLAGWVAISFGNFYKTGDRVQLGGIKGDVITGTTQAASLRLNDGVTNPLP